MGLARRIKSLQSGFLVIQESKEKKRPTYLPERVPKRHSLAQNHFVVKIRASIKGVFREKVLAESTRNESLQKVPLEL